MAAPANIAAVPCTKCNAPLMPADAFNGPGLIPCPVCGKLLHLEIFPALYRRIAPGRAGEAVVEEVEASCFYHPQKKAVLPCESCGRFVCALCDCVLHGQHLCPACLESGRNKGKIKSLENRRVLHDSMALGFAVISMIPYFFWFAAPAAIYISIRRWNAPNSIVPRGKFRYVLAIIISVLVLLGWTAAFYGIFHNVRTHPR
jgi:hypothetical protein